MNRPQSMFTSSFPGAARAAEQQPVQVPPELQRREHLQRYQIHCCQGSKILNPSQTRALQHQKSQSGRGVSALVGSAGSAFLARESSHESFSFYSYVVLRQLKQLLARQSAQTSTRSRPTSCLEPGAPQSQPIKQPSKTNPLQQAIEHTSQVYKADCDNFSALFSLLEPLASGRINSINMRSNGIAVHTDAGDITIADIDLSLTGIHTLKGDRQTQSETTAQLTGSVKCTIFIPLYFNQPLAFELSLESFQLELTAGVATLLHQYSRGHWFGALLAGARVLLSEQGISPRALKLSVGTAQINFSQGGQTTLARGIQLAKSTPDSAFNDLFTVLDIPLSVTVKQLKVTDNTGLGLSGTARQLSATLEALSDQPGPLSRQLQVAVEHGQLHVANPAKLAIATLEEILPVSTNLKPAPGEWVTREQGDTLNQITGPITLELNNAQVSLARGINNTMTDNRISSQLSGDELLTVSMLTQGRLIFNGQLKGQVTLSDPEHCSLQLNGGINLKFGINNSRATLALDSSSPVFFPQPVAATLRFTLDGLSTSINHKPGHTFAQAGVNRASAALQLTRTYTLNACGLQLKLPDNWKLSSNNLSATLNGSLSASKQGGQIKTSPCRLTLSVWDSDGDTDTRIELSPEALFASLQPGPCSQQRFLSCTRTMVIPAARVVCDQARTALGNLENLDCALDANGCGKLRASQLTVSGDQLIAALPRLSGWLPRLVLQGVNLQLGFDIPVSRYAIAGSKLQLNSIKAVAPEGDWPGIKPKALEYGLRGLNSLISLDFTDSRAVVKLAGCKVYSAALPRGLVNDSGLTPAGLVHEQAGISLLGKDTQVWLSQRLDSGTFTDLEQIVTAAETDKAPGLNSRVSDLLAALPLQPFIDNGDSSLLLRLQKLLMQSGNPLLEKAAALNLHSRLPLPPEMAERLVNQAQAGAIDSGLAGRVLLQAGDRDRALPLLEQCSAHDLPAVQLCVQQIMGEVDDLLERAQTIDKGRASDPARYTRAEHTACLSTANKRLARAVEKMASLYRHNNPWAEQQIERLSKHYHCTEARQLQISQTLAGPSDFTAIDAAAHQLLACAEDYASSVERGTVTMTCASPEPSDNLHTWLVNKVIERFSTPFRQRLANVGRHHVHGTPEQLAEFKDIKVRILNKKTVTANEYYLAGVYSLFALGGARQDKVFARHCLSQVVLERLPAAQVFRRLLNIGKSKQGIPTTSASQAISRQQKSGRFHSTSLHEKCTTC